jgi:hypothetical protein
MLKELEEGQHRGPIMGSLKSGNDLTLKFHPAALTVSNSRIPGWAS